VAGAQGQGLEVLNIGLTYKPNFAPKYWARGDFFSFSRAEDTVKTNNLTGATAKVGDKFGTEIDITLGYNHSDNVGLEIGYAMFNVDDAISGVVNTTSDDAITKMFGRATVRWGGAND